MSSTTPSGAGDVIRLPAVLAGVILTALYLELGTAYDFGSTAGVRFSLIANGELLFFLAHLVLAVPGLLLVGYGLAPWAGPRLRRALRASLRLRALGVGYFVALFAIDALGRLWVLRGQPITDDENMILFGARMLARGHLRVPVLQPEGAFNQLYTYQRDGFVSSADFAGGVLMRAASLVTHLDALLYALAAALTGCALAYAAGLLAGRRASRVAAVLFLVSPMALCLSLTTHAHVASRAFVAFAILFYLRVVRDGRWRDGVLLGVCGGAAWLCRPFEAMTLLSFVALHVGLRAARDVGARRVALALVAGLLPALAVFAWYNLHVTGTWYLMPRFGPGARQFTQIVPQTPGERIGSHVAFTVLLVIVWFLGPLGAAAAARGIARRVETQVLFGGVVAAFALMLFHDNIGIHVVGPIHYSECVAPLTLLATLGLLDLWDRVRAPAARNAFVAAAAAYVLAIGLFDQVALANLADQADVERLPFDALARAGVHHAIVVAASPAHLRGVNRQARAIGSWVNEFPPPDPSFEDDLLFVSPTTDLAALRRRFPDRRLVRLVYEDGPVPVRVEPLDGDGGGGGGG